MEVPGFTPDRHLRARSVGLVDQISAKPAMPFSRHVASLSPFDYLEVSRSRYGRNNTEVLGRWKHYNRSSDTLNTRNSCADSPLISRELNRYFSSSGKTDCAADMGWKAGANNRHYNYRSVPYFGASDNYHNLYKMFQEQNRKEGRAF